MVTETDVEMKTADSPAECEAVKGDPDALTIEDLKEQARHIERAVNNKEPRFILRILRALMPTRKRLNAKVMHKMITGFYTHSTQQRDALIAYLDEPMEAKEGRIRSAKTSHLPLLPELDVYIHLLLLVYLVDTEHFEQAVKCSDELMQKIQSQNRRTLDLLAAKCYFYHSRCYELTGQMNKIRSYLHGRLRTATLRNDYEGQAVLLNCLLRNYLQYNLFDQAAKLISKAPFPEMASNNEWARFLYYMGRIHAIQLDYSEAHKNLLQAIRKAPQHTAVGFKQTVYKLAITVELLLGDIPDRSIFRQPQLRRTLAPYFQLTQAVRAGNLGRFGEVVENFGAKFQADHTYTLIIRLRHNVIKTGVRMINLSYLRISLVDVAHKLQLDSPEDAEFIVAKAIRDGVIEASIDHEKGYMQSKENIDIYCTREPQAAFHQRISFCLNIHNQSVKAMRFPPKSYNKDLESAEERREREQQDLEYAKEMADEDDDGFP
ncbi:26S proteasome non-ATPase regulatory subunit 3-like [Ornithodoros turicata]|uniref:26S proteasome non-ATPase regulatory subunit 3-like n=1 Tax=Ornithodoros turicata TaxID=34597 RepID=UPI00313A2555